MYVSITSLRLRTPFHFFALSYNALQILKQLKKTPCKQVKTVGVGLTHFTMTLWETEADMKAFARSGAHLEAMKKSARIAKEIRICTYQADSMPPWNEAKETLFEKGKLYSYK